jgi:hypothetical protein
VALTVSEEIVAQPKESPQRREVRGQMLDPAEKQISKMMFLLSAARVPFERVWV